MAGGGEGGGLAQEKIQAAQTAQRLLAEGAASDTVEMPEDYKYLPEKLKALEIRLKEGYAEQEIGLREAYAKGLLLVLAVELIVVNVLFWLYAEKGKNWDIPDGVIQIWLGATVVQVVGIVGVVTRYLFPRRDNGSDATPPAS